MMMMMVVMMIIIIIIIAIDYYYYVSTIFWYDDDDEDEKFCKFPGRSESTGHPCSWGARTLSCSRTVEIWAVFKTLFSYHLLPIPRGKFGLGDLRLYWLVLIPSSGWLNHGSPVIIIRWFSPHNNPIPLWMLSP
jgi:hypothetical protein